VMRRPHSRGCHAASGLSGFAPVLLGCRQDAFAFAHKLVGSPSDLDLRKG